MLGSLAPARRRLVLGVAGVGVLALVAVVVAVVVGRDPGVRPVEQSRPGPVLLVPGYGGSTTALEELARALEEAGRTTELVPAPGDGTGDLRDHARALGAAAERALERGAPSVDVVGYSAGGVVVRYWVRDLGGDGQARRVVSLASPQHGTDLAALAGSLTTDACPTACRQLAPDSDLLRGLDAGDPTPPGPRWVALWTEDDATVVPPVSGELDGALSYAVQDVCPGLRVGHADVPRSGPVQAMVLDALSGDARRPPPASVCGS